MKELKDLKKRKDGYYAKTFNFEGKRYTVYAKTKADLIKKVDERICLLEQEVGREVIDDDLSEIHTTYKKRKKGKDGRYQRTFTYNNRRYYVRATSLSELNRKFREKKDEIILKRKEKQNPTFETFFEKWLDNRRGYVKESTLRSEQCHYNSISKIKVDGKKIKDFRLSEIRPDDIRVVQKHLLEQEKNRTQTVNDKIMFLSHIFHDAIREQYIDYNPCHAVKPLRKIEKPARETIHRALTLEETEIFFKAAKNDVYYPVFCFAISTGLRIGEIGALKYSDIYDGAIHCVRTLTRSEFGGYYIGSETKTWHGKRVIPLNETIKKIIDLQRKSNIVLDEGDRIFKAPKGGLLMATPIDRHIKKICVETGIEHFGTHAFRDTFATRAIESGVEPRTLQELLGHADYAITMNLYVHVTNPTLQSAMNRINIGF